MFYDDESDIAGYKNTIMRLLAKPGERKVDTELFKKAREVGAISERGEWVNQLEDLSDDFKQLFVGDPTLVKEKPV